MASRRSRRGARPTRQPKLTHLDSAPGAAGPQPAGLELLEQRNLLTTLVGGDSFEIRNPLEADPNAADARIRVTLSGNIIAELVGTIQNNNNAVTVQDARGTWYASLVGHTGQDSNGGVHAGEDRISVIGPTPIPGRNPPDINYLALAADPTVQAPGAVSAPLYGFNSYSFTPPGGQPTNVIQLIQLGDPAGLTPPGRATIRGTADGVWPVTPPVPAFSFVDPNGAIGSALISANAAAFQPNSTVIYVAVQMQILKLSAANADPADPKSYVADYAVPELFAVNIADPANPVVTPIIGRFGFVPNPNGNNGATPQVAAMSFDPATGTLNAFIVHTVFVNGQQVVRGDLVTVSLANSDTLTNVRPVQLNWVSAQNPGTNVQDIIGLSFTPAGLFATGAAGNLYQIDIGTGHAVLIGSTIDPLDNGNPKVGTTLGDVTWDPTRINPFTNAPGVLLGTDTARDDLVAIDTRVFTPMDTFTLYVSQSDASATISVGSAKGVDLANRPGPNPGEGNYPMTPYTGDSGPLRIVNFNNGQLVQIGSPANTGEAYLGARNQHIINNNAPRNYIPILTTDYSANGGPTGNMGVRPIDTLLDPNTGRPSVQAGLEVPSSLLSYLDTGANYTARLMAGATYVHGLAMNTDGTLAAFSYDPLGAVPNRLVLMGPAQLTAGSPQLVTGTTQVALTTTGAGAIAWGDPAYTGTNSLYAIMPTAAANDPDANVPIGPLNATQALVISLRGLAINTLFAQPTANPGAILAIGTDPVTGDDEIVQLSPNTGAAVVLGIVEDVGGNPFTNGNLLALAFDDTGVLYGVVDHLANAAPGSGMALVKIEPRVAATTNGNILFASDPSVVGTTGQGLLLDANPQGAPAIETNNQVKGLAVDASGNLWMVRRNLAGTADELMSLTLPVGGGNRVAESPVGAPDPATGDPLAVPPVLPVVTGRIIVMDNTQVPPVEIPTHIVGMGFDEQGRLVALSNDGAGNAFLISVNTTRPDLSSVIAPPNGNPGPDPSIMAFGLGRNGTAFLAYGYNTTAVGGTPQVPLYGELFVSPGKQMSLGIIDTGSGAFTGPLDVNGAPTANPLPLGGGITGVVAMAFSRDRRLYIVDQTDTLIEIDPFTGQIATDPNGNPRVIGQIVDANTGGVIPINAIAFDAAGQLYGQDLTQGRLVDISLTGYAGGLVPAGATVATPTGSLPPSVGGIAFDHGGNVNPGSFLAADNATGTLIRPTGEPGTGNAAALLGMSLTPHAQSMGAFLYGGVVSGKVSISGSIKTAYAGWWITGNTNGEVAGTPTIPANFVIGGDLRNLYGLASMSANGDAPKPTFYTGMDMTVGGRVGQIHVTGGGGTGSFLGSFNVGDSDSLPATTPLNALQTEVENRRMTSFQGGALAGDLFANDTTATAEFLGTINNAALGITPGVRLLGTLENDVPNNNPANDYIDYYAVPLMAGQTVVVQVISLNLLAPVDVGVFDPDGRLVATDFAASRFGPANQPFAVTADRPGIYYFGVVDVPAAGGNVTTAWTTGTVRAYGLTAPYELDIQNVGEVAVGGVTTSANIIDMRTANCFQVGRGDMGAFYAGGNVLSKGIPTMTVAQGNLRAVDAMSIGQPLGTLFGLGFDLVAPGGGVGLLRGRDPAGVVAISPSLNAVIDPTVQGIGGDYQVIDAAGTYFGNLTTNRGVGVVRAGNMATLTASTFVMNRDAAGNDGHLDLLDVTGDLGTFLAGGPVIAPGLGGDVGYIRVGGHIYQDHLYGGGGTDNTTHNPGESVTVTDDSGGTITLSPTGTVANPLFVAGGNLPQTVGASLTSLRTYGISGGNLAKGGGGGVVVVDVASSGGLTVTGSTGNTGNPVEVSKITVNGVGKPIIQQAGANGLPGPFVIDPASLNQNLTVAIQGTGSSKVNVLEIDGGAFTSITNPSGEIAIVNATSIGTLMAKSLGYGHSHTGAAVNPIGAILNTFPFLDQRTGIKVSGSALSVMATQDLGNIDVGGTLVNVIANTTGVTDPTKQVFAGIVGPVHSATHVGMVNIGDGILPSGTGNLSRAGVYAGSTGGGLVAGIDSVVGTIRYADIRGTIAATGVIGAVTLNNSGSLIAAQVLSIGDIAESRIYVQTTSFLLGGSTTSPVYGIGAISLSGTGGIIGTFVSSGDIGTTSVTGGGFGIITSAFTMLRNQGNVTADGYGIRATTFMGGFNVGNLNATGRGTVVNPTTGQRTELATSSFSQSVRLGELNPVDPFYHLAPTTFTDIDVYLGTTRLQPIDPLTVVEPSSTTAGVIDLVLGQGQRSLGTITAFQIRNSDFNYASGIAGVRATDTYHDPRRTSPVDLPAAVGAIKDLVLISGNLGSLNSASDILGLSAQISGPIGPISIQGDFLDGIYDNLNFVFPLALLPSPTTSPSEIRATGPQGDITSITITGNGEGDIIASGRVTTITIGSPTALGTGTLTGNIQVLGVNKTLPNGTVLQTLGTLKLYGAIRNGSLEIDGDTGTVDVAGDFGVSGDALVINGNLQTLRVGSDPRVNGSLLGASISIDGNLGTADITGGATGNVAVKGNVTRFTVTADPVTRTAANIMAGNLNVTGTLTTFQLIGGSLAGQVIAGNGLQTAMISGGGMLAGSALTAALGGITSAVISGGGLAGAITAPNGTINAITVSGDMAATGRITAEKLRMLSIQGAMRSGARVNVQRDLGPLSVSQSIEAGTAISAGTAVNIIARQDLLADLTIGNAATGVVLSAGRDFGGASTIDSNATITVSRNYVAGSSLRVSRNLNSLAVVGAFLGDLFVDGSATSITAASATNAVITAGQGLTTLALRGPMTNSLVQVGLTPGTDGTFGTGDLGENRQMADLTSFSAMYAAVGGNALANSIIAVGGTIRSFVATGSLSETSVSSGVVLDGKAVQAVIDDGTPLATVGERGAARVNNTLFRGDFTSAVVRGDLKQQSFLTAGVAPGLADGIFDGPGHDEVARSLTGGKSAFGAVVVTGAIDSTPLGKSLIEANAATAGFPAIQVKTYTIANLTTDAGSPLPSGATTTVLTATQGHPVSIPFTVNGVTQNFTVTVTGLGSVDVYDDSTTTDRVDALVLRGTLASTRVAVVTPFPDAIGLGRVLAEDNTALAAFTFNGDLMGDGTPALDVALDSAVPTVTFRDMPSDGQWTGRIGGDVATLTLRNQGSGKLYVGGRVTTLNLTGSAGHALFDNLGTPQNPLSTGILQMAADSTGGTWVYDSNGLLALVDPVTGQVITDPGTLAQRAATVTLDYGPVAPLPLEAMGFGPGDVLNGVSSYFNPSPTVRVGALLPGNLLDLHGLTVNSANAPTATNPGAIFTVATTTVNGVTVDVLVQINPASGLIVGGSVIEDGSGNLYGANVLALTFNSNGTLFALVNDVDGAGPNPAPLMKGLAANSVALVKIDPLTTGIDPTTGLNFVVATSPSLAGGAGLPGVFVNTDPANPITPVLDGPADTFTALTADDAGNLYAIRRTNGQDYLVQLTIAGRANTTTVTLTPVGGGTGLVQLNGADTQIVGMGFDGQGNLLALSSDGVDPAQLIALNLADPSTSAAASGATLNPALGGFALARDGADRPSYAFDTQTVGGTFFTNPGTVSTLGTIDTSTNATFGTFTALQPLAQTATGTALSSPVLSIAVHPDGTLFAVTADGRLLAYDGTDGAFITDRGPITDSVTGAPLQVTSLAFDLTDPANPVLVGIDAAHNRLVTINPVTAHADADTERGSALAAELPTLTYNPAPGSAGFYAYDSADSAFVKLHGTTQAALGGLTANAVTNLTVTDGAAGYSGRVVATGDGFTAVRVTGAGDFGGNLVTPGLIRTFTQTGGGNFGGALLAGGDITSFSLTGGDLLATGAVSTGGALATFTLTPTAGNVGGTLLGDLEALRATMVRVAGTAASTGQITVPGAVSTLQVTGPFGGTMNLGSVSGSLQVTGLLQATASLRITYDAAAITLAAGTGTGSSLLVGGSATSLTVGGVHNGQIAIRQGLSTGRFATLGTESIDPAGAGASATGALVSVGMDTTSLIVTGSVYNSVLSFGTWVGSGSTVFGDGVYNTADDVILGGSAQNVTIRGDFVNSALVAGVLPRAGTAAQHDTPNLPEDNLIFVGDPAAAALADQDSAEVGGLMPSRLQSVTIGGNVVDELDPVTGIQRYSVTATADGHGTVFPTGKFRTAANRTYRDPIGAPTVTQVTAQTDAYVITFSEPVNTASLVLAQDVDGDHQLLSPNDVQGTILLVDPATGAIISDNVTLSYTTQTTAAGVVQGVLRIVRVGGFPAGTQVLLRGDLAGLPNVIYDRSGLRSGLRDFNQDGVPNAGEDVFGTVLDGDGNGVEGGNYTPVVITGDAPDTFTAALGSPALTPTLDGPMQQLVGNSFTSATDVDILHFQGVAGEYFSVQFNSPEPFNPVPAAMGLFFENTHGTGFTGDDTFEVVARPADNQDPTTGGTLFEAFELPASGDYFIEIAFSTAGAFDAANANYTLNVALASTDTGLATALGATLTGVNGGITLADGTPEQIAYVNNVNNPAKQLVYLNFAGGTTTQFTTNVAVPAFNPSVLDATLAGQTAALITAITTETMAPYVSAGIPTHLISDAASRTAYDQATDGLWFVSDPQWLNGVAPDQINTVFIGAADPTPYGGPGTFGFSSNIDLANLQKNDQNIIFAGEFTGLGTAPTTNGRITEYAQAIGSTAAHELGHTLGLVHTVRLNVTPTVPVGSISLMTAGSLNTFPDDFFVPNLLGTAALYDQEFLPLGDQNSVFDLLAWLT